MNIEKERKAFERWVTEKGLIVSIYDGLYKSHVVGWMWHAWQARAMMEERTKKGKHMSTTHEVDDSEFEKWWTQFKSDEFRLAESGWTEKEIAKLAWRSAIKADEQAVLKSPGMQALRSDSERMKAALKRIAGMDSMSYHSLETAKITAKAAMEQK